MERDESVPLAFEEAGGEQEVPGMPAITTRRAVPGVAPVIDITGMIGELETARRPGGGD